ncbi:MAG: hypothetical protein HQL30_04680 [Candidatus Omnitrophica bacterium]|nr:hypothetical protein [Candidatus Omnitrophota bacterium]
MMDEDRSLKDLGAKLEVLKLGQKQLEQEILSIEMWLDKCLFEADILEDKLKSGGNKTAP